MSAKEKLDRPVNEFEVGTNRFGDGQLLCCFVEFVDEEEDMMLSNDHDGGEEQVVQGKNEFTLINSNTASAASSNMCK